MYNIFQKLNLKNDQNDCWMQKMWKETLQSKIKRWLSICSQKEIDGTNKSTNLKFKLTRWHEKQNV